MWVENTFAFKMIQITLTITVNNDQNSFCSVETDTIYNIQNLKEKPLRIKKGLQKNDAEYLNLRTSTNKGVFIRPLLQA